MKLLAELAGDIAFAIDHIDKQERLDYLAYYDVLTGLANRALFSSGWTQTCAAPPAAAQAGRVAARPGAVQEHQRHASAARRRRAADAVAAVADAHRRSTRASGARGCGPFRRGDSRCSSRRRGGAPAREARWTRSSPHPFRLDGTVFRVCRQGRHRAVPGRRHRRRTCCSGTPRPRSRRPRRAATRYLFYTQKMTERVAEQAHAGEPAAPGARQRASSCCTTSPR